MRHTIFTVRLATESETIARSRRNGNLGAWLVIAQIKGRIGDGCISSHNSKDEAFKAAEIAVRKAIKRGETSEFISYSKKDN
jgi:hypothetical protein